MKGFGENLKKERMAKNISQAEFARLIGSSQQRVSQWECNKIEPTLYNIIAMLKILNITFEDLTEDI